MKAFISDVLSYNITKGIYKIHKQYFDFQDYPILLDYLDKFIVKIKNKIYFIPFTKAFKVEKEVFYLSSKLEDLQKDKISLYLLYKLTNLIKTAIKANEIDKFQNLILKLGWKRVPLFKKKVMKEEKYFLTLDLLFNKNEKLVGFYVFQNPYEIFFEPKFGRNIRAEKQLQYNPKIDILNLYTALNFIKQLKSKPIIKNLLMYLLTTDALEIQKNDEQKRFLIELFLLYLMMPKDIQKLFIDGDKVYKENVKRVLGHYYALILQDVGNFKS